MITDVPCEVGGLAFQIQFAGRVRPPRHLREADHDQSTHHECDTIPESESLAARKTQEVEFPGVRAGNHLLEGGNISSSEPQSRFAETYSRMSLDDLVRLMSDSGSLVPEAASALALECKKRGLDAAGAKTYQEETTKEVLAARREEEAGWREYRKGVWRRRLTFGGIFFGGAILTVVLAGYLFGSSNEFERLLTMMLLGVAMAATVLSLSFGGRWLTTKRTCVAALLLSCAELIWIFVVVSRAARKG